MCICNSFAVVFSLVKFRMAPSVPRVCILEGGNYCTSVLHQNVQALTQGQAYPNSNTWHSHLAVFPLLKSVPFPSWSVLPRLPTAHKISGDGCRADTWLKQQLVSCVTKLVSFNKSQKCGLRTLWVVSPRSFQEITKVKLYILCYNIHIKQRDHLPCSLPAMNI